MKPAVESTAHSNYRRASLSWDDACHHIIDAFMVLILTGTFAHRALTEGWVDAKLHRIDEWAIRASAPSIEESRIFMTYGPPLAMTLMNLDVFGTMKYCTSAPSQRSVVIARRKRLILAKR